MSRVILLFFYKNFILTVITFGYVFVNDYSGMTIFNSGLLVGYNLLYTTFPLIILGVFDQDLSHHEIFNNLHIYTQGIKNSLFSYKSLFYYSMHSIIQGCILLLLISQSQLLIANQYGMNGNLDIFGCALFIGIVLTVLLHVFIETYSFSIIYLFSHFVSVTLLICYIIIITESRFPDYDLIGIGEIMSHSTIVLIVFLVSPFVAICPHYFVNLHKHIFKSGFQDKL